MSKLRYYPESGTVIIERDPDPEAPPPVPEPDGFEIILEDDSLEDTKTKGFRILGPDGKEIASYPTLADLPLGTFPFEVKF